MMPLTVDRKPAKVASRGMLVAVCTDDGSHAWALLLSDTPQTVVDSLAGANVTGADLEARGFRVTK